jgi:hypothetical protein
VARGAYHFMTWCSLASEQANWFIKMVPNDRDALPPVLDLEWNNHSSCKNTHNRADILEKVRVMLAAMEAHTGKVPIIYTDMTFHRDILEGEHFDNPFWLRSVAAEPHQRYRGRRLAVLAVDADRHDAGHRHRGGPQRLLRIGRRVGNVPAHRVRSAPVAQARTAGPLPREIALPHWAAALSAAQSSPRFCACDLPDVPAREKGKTDGQRSDEKDEGSQEAQEGSGEDARQWAAGANQGEVSFPSSVC